MPLQILVSLYWSKWQPFMYCKYDLTNNLLIEAGGR